MFSKITLLFAAFSIAFIISPTQTQAEDGHSFGFSAAIAMPSGLVPSAGIPTTAGTNINFTYGYSTNFLMMIGEQLQIEAGIGYVSVSTSIDAAGAKNPDPISTISFSAGGRYFLRTGDVQPYVGGGLSFTSLPSTTINSKEVSASLLSFIGFVGAQGFINTSRTVALFIQMGFGYNSASGNVTDPITFVQSEGSTSSFNFGGSAVGATVYF